MVAITSPSPKCYRTRRRTNVVLMLAHRLRRWSNNKTTLVRRPVFFHLIITELLAIRQPF